MSKLSAFLKDNNITQAQFAKRIGVHQSTVSRLCDSPASITVPVALKIERATDGVVRVADWTPVNADPVLMQPCINEPLQQSAFDDRDTSEAR